MGNSHIVPCHDVCALSIANTEVPWVGDASECSIGVSCGGDFSFPGEPKWNAWAKCVLLHIFSRLNIKHVDRTTPCVMEHSEDD